MQWRTLQKWLPNTHISKTVHDGNVVTEQATNKKWYTAYRAEQISDSAGNVTTGCCGRKWRPFIIYYYKLTTGVRQGGVLSPCFFGIFIDDLVKLVNKANSGCKIEACCAAIFLYADDIILLAPSVSTLQTLVHICELELVDIDMNINVKISACIRFGLRSKNTRANVVAAGVNIDWVTPTT